MRKRLDMNPKHPMAIAKRVGDIATGKRTWNYRVMSFTKGGETWFEIHEIHYADGVPVLYTEGAADVSWQEGEDPLETFAMMKLALGLPVLTEADFEPPTPPALGRG